MAHVLLVDDERDLAGLIDFNLRQSGFSTTVTYAVVAGEEAPLTALELRLIHHFMTRVGRVQTRGKLLEEVWGLSSSLETRTIDTHVMRLRDKPRPARAYVETVRGVGLPDGAPLALSVRGRLRLPRGAP